jgi:hypothetical protein
MNSDGHINKENVHVATKCPMHLHQVLWNANSSDLSVKIYPSKYLHLFTKPLSSATTANDLDILALQYLNYDDPSLSDDPAVKYRVTQMRMGDYLFVPKDNLVAYTSEAIAESINSDSIDGLHSACLLDASNFKDFIEDAFVLKETNAEVSIFLDQLSSLDLSMLRTVPSDLTLQEIKDLSVIKSTVSSTTDEMKGQTERPNRRNRKSSGQMKDWQEQARWQTLITSLTIWRPSRPQLLAVGRSNVSFQWASPFLPDRADQTLFGFNISACPFTSEPSSSSSSHDRLNYSCKYYAAYRQHDAFKSVEKIPLIEKVDEREYESSLLAAATTFAAAIKDLIPNASYRLAIKAFYSSYSSPLSEQSDVFTTAAVSVPSAIPCLHQRSSCIIASTQSAAYITSCVIHFYQPYDDGGSAIIGYHVWYRRASDTWRYHGKILTQYISSSDLDPSAVALEVSHLHPNTSYSFRIAAFNSHGNSSHTDSSNPVTTKSLSHEKDRQTIRSIDLRQGSINHASSRPVNVLKYLRVDDLEETITVVDPHTTNAEIQHKVSTYI